MPTVYTPDPWRELRNFTGARIALGRSGGSLPTSELLDFQRDHASAIDAVYTQLDTKRLAASLNALGFESIELKTRAADRETFLLRPDRGRRLAEDSRAALAEYMDARESPDVVIALVDGLSALAVQRHAPPLFDLLAKRLADSGISVGPAPLVVEGRVALQDEIGSIMGAKLIVSLIGERPGLIAPDSLGAYFVLAPKAGNTDANRNCVSNIRPEGLGYTAAAETLHYLITEALRRNVSGIALKDDRALLLEGEDRPLL